MRDQKEERKDRQKDAIRLLQWFWENPSIKEVICAEDIPGPQECVEIVRRLEEMAFYDVIVIFLMRQGYRKFISRVCKTMFVDELNGLWAGDRIDALFETFIEMLGESADNEEELRRTDNPMDGTTE